MTVAGVSPPILMIGFVPATSEALGAGVSLDDVELDEAFAAQVLAVLQI